MIFHNLLNRKIKKIEGGREGDEYMNLVAEDGSKFCFWHSQNCCESVAIEDVAGDLDDLIDSVICQAEEVSNLPEPELSNPVESYTWTFYKFATNKGSVTIRWFGTSNGYYSESVSYKEELVK